MRRGKKGHFLLGMWREKIRCGNQHSLLIEQDRMVLSGHVGGSCSAHPRIIQSIYWVVDELIVVKSSVKL